MERQRGRGRDSDTSVCIRRHHACVLASADILSGSRIKRLKCQLEKGTSARPSHGGASTTASTSTSAAAAAPPSRLAQTAFM